MGAFGALVGCAPAGGTPVGTVEPLPRQGMTAAGWYAWRDTGRVVAVDSFWVYHAPGGGRVLRVERHDLATRARGTTWLHVDPMYRPIRGWYRSSTRSGACLRTFQATSRTLTIGLQGGRLGRGTSLSLELPGAAAITLPDPVSSAWGMRLAQHHPEGVVQVVLPDCDPGHGAPAAITPTHYLVSAFTPHTSAAASSAGDSVLGSLGTDAWRVLRQVGALGGGGRQAPDTLWVSSTSGLLARVASPGGPVALLEHLWRAGQ
jgi:hypothetical protein